MNARFSIGEKVRVREAYPPGHVRTPYYIRGKSGVVADMVGAYANPEQAALGDAEKAERQPLYRVRFRQTEAWPDYDGSPDDTVDIEIYQHWLEPNDG